GIVVPRGGIDKQRWIVLVMAAGAVRLMATGAIGAVERRASFQAVAFIGPLSAARLCLAAISLTLRERCFRPGTLLVAADRRYHAQVGHHSGEVVFLQML